MKEGLDETNKNRNYIDEEKLLNVLKKQIFSFFFFNVHFSVRFTESFRAERKGFQRFVRTFTCSPEKSKMSGVNFTIILQAAFMSADPNYAKRH